MRSRWFHHPILHLHSPEGEKRVSWLELFFDLIFVASFIQLGDALSKHIDMLGILSFCGLFVPLWVSWIGFTFYMNRYNIDDFLHRLFVLFQMMAIGGITVSAPFLLDGYHRAFAMSFALAQGGIAALHVRTWFCYRLEERRKTSRYWGAVFGSAGLIWLLSAFVDPPWAYGLWVLGTLLVFASPFPMHARRLMADIPMDYGHLSERFGLLTLIVLGEAFVKVLTTLSQREATPAVYVEAAILLLLVSALWWIYFDDVAGAQVRLQRLMPVIWIYAHLPLQMALVATGVALKKVVSLDSYALPLKPEYGWLLACTVGACILSVAAIDSVTERKQAELSDRARVSSRVFLGILILLLAPASQTMSAGLFVTLIALGCVTLVFFDMLMAPMEEAQHLEAEPVEARGAPGVGRPRTPERHHAVEDMQNAVRKGTPSDLRHDLYFYFMDGGWIRLFSAMGILYLLMNVLFACLYLLVPGSVNGADANSFSDAFFFSVQTMSTIGYGQLTPGNLHANLIVTLEAAVGLLGVALATGLIFAKVSRPTSKVLFSRSMVIMKRDGEDLLVFQCGNARGNQIVDATVEMTLVKDEVSKEGDRLKKLHDLTLARKRSPLFTLSWMVMHPIDEDSPLYGLDRENLMDCMEGIVVTLSGHDDTYAQDIYARHYYAAEDIHAGYRFVDNVSRLQDGRLMIDYGRFHDIEAQ